MVARVGVLRKFTNNGTAQSTWEGDVERNFFIVNRRFKKKKKMRLLQDPDIRWTFNFFFFFE